MLFSGTAVYGLGFRVSGLKDLVVFGNSVCSHVCLSHVGSRMV